MSFCREFVGRRYGWGGGRHELLDPDFVMALSLQRSPGPLGDLHTFVKVAWGLVSVGPRDVMAAAAVRLSPSLACEESQSLNIDVGLCLKVDFETACKLLVSPTTSDGVLSCQHHASADIRSVRVSTSLSIPYAAVGWLAPRRVGAV